MQTLKLNHMPGGKVLAVILIALVVILIGAVIALFLTPHISIGFVPGIMIIVAVGGSIWLAYKFFKPGFTEVIFTKDGIISKTPSLESQMRVKDMKGIWLISLPIEQNEFEEYGPNNRLRKNTLVLFGDVRAFEGATTFGLVGTPGTLYDTFGDNYATIYYRKNKGIDEFVELYYKKIQER